MREIKFRLWIPSLNKMVYQEEGYWFVRDGRVEMIFEDDIPDYEDEAILIQYTGLLDKNGKEIYEGDIADVNYMGFARFRVQIVLGEYEQDGSGGEYSATKCVGFYAKALNPDALDEDECRIVPEYLRETSILSFESIEVIGNIYENPELINS